MALFAIFSAISAASALAGGFAQYQAGQSAASGYRASGEAQRRAAQYAATIAGRKADALIQRAGQSRAASQRGAIEDRRLGRLITSRARARAGASGAAVSSPSVVNLIGELDEDAEYRALTSLSRGEEAARGDEYSAELAKAEARGLIYGGEVSQNYANFQADLSERTGAMGLLSGFMKAGGIGASYYAGSAPAAVRTPQQPTIAHGGTTLYSNYNAPFRGAMIRGGFAGMGGYR